MRIKKLELDVIHIFTPSQIGLVFRASHKYTRYPALFSIVRICMSLLNLRFLPGILALAGIIFPMSVKLKARDIGRLLGCIDRAGLLSGTRILSRR